MKTIILQDYQIEAVLRSELCDFATALLACTESTRAPMVEAEDIKNFRSYLQSIERLCEILEAKP